MIVGGGTIAIFLARMLLEMKMRVVIIEQSKERCELLADLLPDATVVNGDGTSKNLLFEENLENAEAFVALTNMDEENILLGMFAERMSHAKVVTKVNRVAFDDICLLYTSILFGAGAWKSRQAGTSESLAEQRYKNQSGKREHLSLIHI